MKEHFDTLTLCLQKNVVKSRDLVYNPNTNNTILDFSVDGVFFGYEGKFTSSFVVNHLSIAVEVSAWVENVVIAINGMMTANETENFK